MTPTTLHRYDWILLGIALALAAGVAVGLFTGVALSTAVAAGVIAATPFVYDALVRNPPVPPGEPGHVAATVAWHAVLLGAILVALG